MVRTIRLASHVYYDRRPRKVSVEVVWRTRCMMCSYFSNQTHTLQFQLVSTAEITLHFVAVSSSMSAAPQSTTRRFVCQPSLDSFKQQAAESTQQPAGKGKQAVDSRHPALRATLSKKDPGILVKAMILPLAAARATIVWTPALKRVRKSAATHAGGMLS